MTGQSRDLLIGVDVGTASARAGVFDLSGQMLASAKAELQLWHGPGAMVEQSSQQVWQAICTALRQAMQGLDPDRVAGLGFDATCSLVVLDRAGHPLPVGPTEEAARNIILWMDHRAQSQAQRINAQGHAVLAYVGGRISPEMQTPKLLWLKENRPEIYQKAGHFMDLADYLTWRASGDLSRSTCTVTCKWTYLAHEKRWEPDYFQAIGLGDLAQEDFTRIGQSIVDPGTPLGQGLSESAAADLGLLPGTAVGAGIIDAHAGGIGTVGIEGNAQSHMAYVFGTSSCTMTSTKEPVFVPGVWGPYYSAMVPGLWLNEGGQSAAGAAIAQLLDFHPASSAAKAEAAAKGLGLPDYLSEKLDFDADLSGLEAALQGLHVVPEFLGNRAPHADPAARALIAGLGMERDEESLAALYLAGLCGIGYGLRQILETQAQAGAPVEKIVISGGAGRAPWIRQLLADAADRPVLASQAQEPVLLGAAILAAVAAGAYPDIATAMQAMSRKGSESRPTTAANRALHQKRYESFTRLQSLARDIR